MASEATARAGSLKASNRGAMFPMTALQPSLLVRLAKGQMTVNSPRHALPGHRINLSDSPRPARTGMSSRSLAAFRQQSAYAEQAHMSSLAHVTAKSTQILIFFSTHCAGAACFLKPTLASTICCHPIDRPPTFTKAQRTKPALSACEPAKPPDLLSLRLPHHGRRHLPSRSVPRAHAYLV